MAYGKRGYRTARRYNRKGRKLSNKYIYGYRGAKSQANQIAALRNRINKAIKYNKPEVKTIITQAETVSYTSESTSTYHRAYPIASPTLGNGDSERQGNYIKVLNGVVYLSMEYFNSSQTGYHNGESSGCQVRVVIGQWTSAHTPTQVPAVDNVFEYPSGTGANYTQMALSPLKTGITNSNYILRDVRFPLTSERNQKMIKIPFKPRKPYVFDDRGNFPNTWVMIVVAGLHYDSDFTETVKVTVSDKLVYLDK